MSSQKCLGKGSAPPGPVPEGLIRHYSMRFCPFAQRSRMVLAAKGIQYEDVNINLKNKPDWFFEKNPLGLVPVIETSDGKIIYESAVVCEYLDEVFPGVKLTPSDPYEKAKQKMLQEQFSAVSTAFYKIRTASDEDAPELWAQFFEKLKKIDEGLAKKNTPYFGGNSVAMIDYLLWPWFERFNAFCPANTLEKTPQLKAWYDLMMQDAAVKATYTKPEVFVGFYKEYFANNPEACDYGLE
ncbi:glutathione S-transferase omega-1-like [Gastrophryne carolinensis]